MIRLCCFPLLFFLLFTLFGCGAPSARPPVPVPEVVVESVLVRDVQPYIEETGITDAYEYVEIPARVSGFLQAIRYADGDIVAVGTPLFLIQPEQYQAELKAAEGVLASAQAQLNLMEANLSRTQRTFEQGASTKEDLDTAMAHRDEAEAAVVQAEASRAIAELNLSYTDIRSPIMGKVAPSIFSVGNMVGPAGRNQILTTVAGMDPIYVNFDISDSQFNSIRAYAREHRAPMMEGVLQQIQTARGDAASGDRESNEETAEQQEGTRESTQEGTLLSGLEEFHIPFEVSLIVGSTPGTGEYPYKGIIETAYNKIDPSTGTITVRGKIPNADYAIFPGQICRVRIPIWKVPDALLVRQEAIGTDLTQRYVYVVDDHNTAHRRVVELGALQPDGTRVVTKGLEAGERYIVSGIQRVRDGSLVKIRD